MTPVQSPRRRADGRGLRSSFRCRGSSSRIPLNIRAGSHPEREGTRLNGRLGKPGGPVGRVAGAVDSHCTSVSWGNAHAAAGRSRPETVKLCERYRFGGQGSILSTVYAPVSGCATTGRKTPVSEENARVADGVNAGTRDFAIYGQVVRCRGWVSDCEEAARRPARKYAGWGGGWRGRLRGRGQYRDRQGAAAASTAISTGRQYRDREGATAAFTAICTGGTV